MRTLAVVPARYCSQRLPGKPLADIGGSPMIEHVYRRAVQSRLIDRVIVATDDERIQSAVVSFGGEAMMTSAHHQSGSERAAEVASRLESFDLVANLQGDEPMIEPPCIDQAIAACRDSGAGVIATLCTRISTREELLDSNVVKVVRDRQNYAMYFSRSPIPHPDEESSGDATGALGSRNPYFKHLGLYVYPTELLLRLTGLEPTPLERLEKLEQLRALENGIKIRVEETESESLSVDTPEDLERVRLMLC